MLMEEPVVLGSDRRTIQLKAPIANRGAALILANDEDYLPAGGLYSPAQLYSTVSLPYRIQRCSGTLGPDNDLLRVVTNGGSVDIRMPTGTLSEQDVLNTIRSATTLVHPIIQSGKLVLTETGAKGPESYIRLAGAAASQLGFAQLGDRGREVYPPWQFAPTDSVYPAVNGPLRGYKQRVWQPQFTAPIKGNPTLKVTYVAPATRCPRCRGTYVENDYRFDLVGDPLVVRNDNLLYQMCLKALLTEKGSNPYHPTYGSSIMTRLGKKRGSAVALLMKDDISAALNAVKLTQTTQMKYQAVTGAERLVQVMGVDVKPKPNDPTVFFIQVTVMNASRKQIALSVVFTVPGAVALAGSNGRSLGMEPTGLPNWASSNSFQ